jgi:ribonuclease BN (tRNA processing enzyme)
VQAGQVAREAGVKRLLITHVPAWYDGEELLAEARSQYDGPAELVRPDAHYTI